MSLDIPSARTFMPASPSLRRPVSFPIGFFLKTRAASAIGLSGALFVQGAQAANITWANTATDFTTGGSWLGGVAPGSADVAIFNAAASTSPNLAASSTLSALQFNNAASSGYTFSNSNAAVLTLLSTGATAGTAALNSANTTGANVISSNLNLGAAAGSTQHFFQSSGGVLTLSGTISSSNSINLSLGTTGTFALTAANTFTGTLTQNAGSAILVGNKDAFSSSVLNFQSNSGRIGATTDLTGVNKLTNAVNLASNVTILGGSALEFGGAVNLAGGGRTIANGNVAGTTFSGVIGNDGGGGLSISGVGMTYLTALNTYTGPTSIAGTSGGSVFVKNIGMTGASSNLGTSGTINMGNTTQAGTLRYQGTGETTDKVVNLAGTTGGAIIDTTGATGALVFSSSIISSGTGVKTLTLGGDTFGNAINGNIVNPTSGTLSLSKTGVGSWTLSGSNTFTGGVGVGAGTLNVRHANALGTTVGATSITSGATLELQGGISVLGEGLTTQGVGVNSNGALRNISGSNTWTGTIGLSGNTEIQSDSGLLTLSGNINSTTVSLRTLAFDGAGDTMVSGILGSQVSTVTKTGTGKLTLSGANLNSGATTFLSGTLELDFSAGSAPTSNILNSSQILTLGNTTAANAGTVVITGRAGTANSQSIVTSGTLGTNFGAYHFDINPGASGGTVTLNLGSLTPASGRNSGFSLDFDLVPGTSVVTTSTNTTAGIIGNGITVNGSDFAMVNSSSNVVAFTSYVTSATNALGTSTQVVNAGTNTSLSAASTTVGGLRFNDAAARTITLSSTSRLSVSNGILVTGSVGNNISRIEGGLLEGSPTRDLLLIQNNTAAALEIGSTIISTNNGGALTKAGLGEAVLSGTSSMPLQTIVNEGKLTVTSNAVAGLTTTGSATLGSNVVANIDTTGLWIGQRVNGSGGVFTGNAVYITSIGANSVTLSANALSSSGSGGTSFDLSAGSGIGSNLSASSALVASGATLQIGNGGTTGTLLTQQGVQNSGTVAFNRADALTFSSTIAGSGAVIQIGSGTTTLEGVQGYAGDTIVSAGTLLVNGTALGSEAVVNSGGTLGGGGTLREIVLNAGGALSPGNSIGTLNTNNGSLVWNGQASAGFEQMKFELSSGSNSSDLINLGTGMLDQGTGTVFAFDFQNTGGSGYTYTLITFGSTDFTVDDFSYTNLATGLEGEFVLNGGSLHFVVSVIPEPSTALLLAGGMTGLLMARRRRS